MPEEHRVLFALTTSPAAAPAVRYEVKGEAGGYGLWRSEAGVALKVRSSRNPLQLVQEAIQAVLGSKGED